MCVKYFAPIVLAIKINWSGVYSSMVAHLAAVAATRVWIPASCQILHVKYKTWDGVRSPGKFFFVFILSSVKFSNLMQHLKNPPPFSQSWPNFPALSLSQSARHYTSKKQVWKCIKHEPAKQQRNRNRSRKSFIPFIRDSDGFESLRNRGRKSRDTLPYTHCNKQKMNYFLFFDS